MLVLKNLRKLLENHSRQATAYRHGGGLQVEAAAATAAEAGRWVAESACPSHDAKTERFVAWGHFSRSIPITFSSTSSSAFYSDGLQWTNGLRQKLLTIAQCNQKFTTITFFPVFILLVLLLANKQPPQKFLISIYDFIFLFQVSQNSLKSLQSEVFTAEIQLSSLFPWSSWPSWAQLKIKIKMEQIGTSILSQSWLINSRTVFKASDPISNLVFVRNSFVYPGF